MGNNTGTLNCESQLFVCNQDTAKAVLLNGELQTCDSNRTTCGTNLADATSEYNQCDSQRKTEQANLDGEITKFATCEADIATFQNQLIECESDRVVNLSTHTTALKQIEEDITTQKSRKAGLDESQTPKIRTAQLRCTVDDLNAVKQIQDACKETTDQLILNVFDCRLRVSGVSSDISNIDAAIKDINAEISLIDAAIAAEEQKKEDFETDLAACTAQSGQSTDASACLAELAQVETHAANLYYYPVIWDTDGSGFANTSNDNILFVGQSYNFTLSVPPLPSSAVFNSTPALPAGLTIGTDGSISGTPTEVTSGIQTYEITLDEPGQSVPLASNKVRFAIAV